ncbi:MAG: DUF2177 family protein [Psychrobacter sp.]|nr:DUF2177 family protein [Psychrobacter sp.]
MGYVWTYLTAIVLFLGIDSVWLKTMTGTFYAPRIGHLLADKPNMAAAGVFYLFYLFALCVIILYPQIKAGASLGHIFMLGALIGLMAYGTYDFTCLALFKDYDTTAALVDFVWGGVLTGTISVATAWLATRFGWLA